MSKQFYFEQFNLALYSFNVKNSSISNHFSKITQFSSIWAIDRTLSGVTTPGHGKPGSDGNEEVLLIPRGCSNIGTSPSEFLVSYPGY